MSGFNVSCVLASGLQLIRSGSKLSSKAIWCLMAVGAGSECTTRATHLLMSLFTGLDSGNWWMLTLTAGDCLVRAFWAYQAFRDASHTAQAIGRLMKH